MIQNMYVVYDVVAKLFHAPFLQESDDSARRVCIQVANDTSIDPGQHPEDYHVYRVASYCTESAQITPETTVQLVFKLNDLVRHQPYDALSPNPETNEQES